MHQDGRNRRKIRGIKSKDLEEENVTMFVSNDSNRINWIDSILHDLQLDFEICCYSKKDDE